MTTDPLIGRIVGDRYRVVDVVGRGAMGIVYEALDRRLHDRAVALKALTIGMERGEMERGEMERGETERFEREARVVARLSSPHTVRVFDVGRLPDSRPFIVMELLTGHTLETRMESGPKLEIAEVIALVDGVLAALDEAHSHGIVHRDLKPANIFLAATGDGPGHSKVLDFGIAKETHDDTPGASATSTLVGTPAYMSPEQIQRDPVDGRADLYTLGVMLYELCAGHPPFRDEDPVPDALEGLPRTFRIGWQHVHQIPTRPDGLSNELWSVFERLMAKRPTDRFADAAAVRAALRAVPEAGGIAELAPSRRSRAPIGAALALACVGGLVCVGGIAWWATRRQPSTTIATTIAQPEPTIIAAPPPDTAAPDTAVPDTAVPDTAVPDTAVPDTAVPDTAVLEHRPAARRISRPRPPAAKAAPEPAPKPRRKKLIF